MSTENVDNKTGGASEATTNLIRDENPTAAVAVAVDVAGDVDGGDDVDYEPCLEIRIKTAHEHCGGIIVDRYETEVDENVLCEDLDDVRMFLPLSQFTFEQLDREIWEMIGLSGDHGAAEGHRYYSTFEYVYDDEGKEARDLECVSDDELKDILAGGSGFVNVVWDW